MLDFLFTAETQRAQSFFNVISARVFILKKLFDWLDAAKGVPASLPRVLAAWMAATKPPGTGLRRPSEGKPELPNEAAFLLQCATK